MCDNPIYGTCIRETRKGREKNKRIIRELKLMNPYCSGFSRIYLTVVRQKKKTGNMSFQIYWLFYNSDKSVCFIYPK